ncbi:MAG TPA: response regulator [Candidatus Binatus sp.]|nr:response regulator [Candidatus Binatus sp.]
MQSKILIVDDDPAVCEMIQDVLNSADIETITDTSSQQAVTRLELEKFQAVFLDMNMPSPDGLELTRWIRASGLNRTTPIVMITGEDDRTLLARAFEAGASFFLFKPIDRHRMLRLIRVAEGPMQREARRYQRVKVSCKVSIELNQEQVSGIALDLSLGGMFVQASRTLPAGSIVLVRLELGPGAPPLNLAARVVRSSANNSMGLQLENNGPEQNKKLQEYLLPLVLARTS